MLDSSRFAPVKWNMNVFSTVTFALLVMLVIIFADTYISNVSLHTHAFENASDSHRPDPLRTRQTPQELKTTATSADDDDVATGQETAVQFAGKRLTREELELFETSRVVRRFDSRVREFFAGNQCKVRVFMTWISPAESFGEREFVGLESLFQTNPKSCLIILSRTMDSERGRQILEPWINLGFCVQAISPDLWALLKNTPGDDWLNDIRTGVKNPGEIPLAQNLSNLIRLAALYKYGGVYLDTDFIILKDLSGLRNSIGAQSVDINGKWTRLNNAALVFDKKHPLVYKFMEEFALTFDGNIWGHNGPYLVSRVVNRVSESGEFNFTILPPMAFYPVDWTRVSRFFVRPSDRKGEKWVEAKVRQLGRLTYGLHLWNKQSRRVKIEEGSILGRLIFDHCVICCRHIASSERAQISLIGAFIKAFKGAD